MFLKIARMSDGVHLDFDGAWGEVAGIPTRELREWGRRLRYIAKPSDIELFFKDVVRSLPPFVLYGSGDFHHLAGLLIRHTMGSDPMAVVSFDNHPDWDIRSPKWACGAWVSRAMELALVDEVSVWGCGNFELAYPSRLFANRSKKLTIHAWVERQSKSIQRRFNCMTRTNWRDRFTAHAETLSGRSIYVTIDMDCLRSEEAITNWENGLFAAEDISWAIAELRHHGNVIAGDLCGAWSEPIYARKFQRFAGWWDHPAEHDKPHPEGRAINLASLQTIWPALIGVAGQRLI